MQPYDLFKLQLNMATLMMDTQTVMALRVMAMSGVIPAHRGENNRMVSEKGPAMTKAFAAATKAMMAGASPDKVLSAAMVPVSKRVSANRKRLSK